MTEWTKGYCISASLGFLDSHAGEKPSPERPLNRRLPAHNVWAPRIGLSLPRIRSEWAFEGTSATILDQYGGVTKCSRQQVVRVWAELMCTLELTRGELSRPRDSRDLPTHEQQLLRYDTHNSSELGGFTSPNQPTKCRNTRPAAMAWNLANSWTCTSSPPAESAS